MVWTTPFYLKRLPFPKLECKSSVSHNGSKNGKMTSKICCLLTHFWALLWGMGNWALTKLSSPFGDGTKLSEWSENHLICSLIFGFWIVSLDTSTQEFTLFYFSCIFPEVKYTSLWILTVSESVNGYQPPSQFKFISAITKILPPLHFLKSSIHYLI